MPEIGPVPAVLRALPFWQPYAWCVVHSTKRTENRRRPPGGLREGDWFGVYAVQGRHLAREDEIAADIYLRTGVVTPSPHDAAIVRGAILGAAQWVGTTDGRDRPDVHARMAASDPWWLGPFALHLGRVVTFAEPVPCWAPHQGCFALDGPMAARVAQRMAGSWRSEHER